MGAAGYHAVEIPTSRKIGETWGTPFLFGPSCYFFRFATRNSLVRFQASDASAAR